MKHSEYKKDIFTHHQSTSEFNGKGEIINFRCVSIPKMDILIDIKIHPISFL